MKAKGFTLIEVMVTVAIVAILAAIAYPSYTDYVRRGQIQDGANNLASGQVAMEQYFQDNKQYTAVGAATPPCPTTSKYFTYACVQTDTTFTITASGTGSVAGFTYTIDQKSNKTSTTPWAVGTQNCWILKKGDSC